MARSAQAISDRRSWPLDSGQVVLNQARVPTGLVGRVLFLVGRSSYAEAISQSEGQGVA